MKRRFPGVAQGRQFFHGQGDADRDSLQLDFLRELRHLFFQSLLDQLLDMYLEPLNSLRHSSEVGAAPSTFSNAHGHYSKGTAYGVLEQLMFVVQLGTFDPVNPKGFISVIEENQRHN